MPVWGSGVSREAVVSNPQGGETIVPVRRLGISEEAVVSDPQGGKTTSVASRGPVGIIAAPEGEETPTISGGIVIASPQGGGTIVPVREPGISGEAVITDPQGEETGVAMNRLGG